MNVIALAGSVVLSHPWYLAYLGYRYHPHALDGHESKFYSNVVAQQHEDYYIMGQTCNYSQPANTWTAVRAPFFPLTHLPTYSLDHLLTCPLTHLLTLSSPPLDHTRPITYPNNLVARTRLIKSLNASTCTHPLEDYTCLPKHLSSTMHRHGRHEI